ncbi:MAG: dihydrodipicolinate synthase family protein [Candidatus Latescibacteria bacterium]|nr:dihydrodipicolinate synthase family protein [Candidatus Latescibacterota bacterium]
MTQSWRGIFPIVITPFTETGELDEAGLRRIVRFCLEAGAAGLVGPANASEFATLSDDERRRWLEVVVGETAGQVPVVASITSGHALPAVELGRFAQGLGAAGVMSMPPHVLHPDAAGCHAYYQALDAALQIPICIQNYNGPIGTPMSGELLAHLCRELTQVQYLKEETLPEPRQISTTLAAVGDHCRGIFGGQGGIYLLDEFRRGTAGNMPGCHTTDVLVDLWQRLEAGAQQEARGLFNRLLPLFNFERLYGVAVYKEILRRRGIIASAFQRAPGGGLDECDRQELEEILKDVEPLFRE